MELAKFEIKSFSANDFKKDAGKKDFVLPINPESFTRNLKVERDNTKAHGTDKTNPKYVGTSPEELKVEFILDGTATMEGYLNSLKNVPVKKQLEKLLECVYDFDGDIHSPRYLKVLYGSQIKMDCVITSLDLNYTLFKADGEPLRVKITANFLQYVDPKSSALKSRKKSPDVTHQRLVKAGDRLDLLTYDIYNSPKYLLQVAMKNELTSIRNLKPGLELLFYPFNKSEA
jgi:hypothetical protein